MNTLYLDIMEKALSAYSPERIRDFIDEVKRDGLTLYYNRNGRYRVYAVSGNKVHIELKENADEL